MADLPIEPDPRLDLLVGVYSEAGRNIARRLDELLLLQGARRFLIYQQILRILEGLGAQTDAWNARYIREFLEESDAAAVAALSTAGAAVSFAAINEVAVEQLANSLAGFMSKARSSVEQLASKIFRSPALEREFPGLAAKVQRQVAVGLAEGTTTAATRSRIAAMLRPQFVDGVVSVIGKGGRRFSFPLDYYAGMVAQATKRQANSVAVLTRAQEAAHDLVRVSTNPSKTGDWCDAYRGRVFSISGAHPVFPPLSALPNGGPPFHPWCRHSLEVFVEQFHTPAQIKEVGKIDPQFLMQPNEDNPNRVVRNWWAAKREDDNPAPLRFR